ncbi:MAG: hypothetical protein IT572_01450 [Deltaproteobacteria bacterium]|nr:hypothetical protein [Deltaproteobacteria bacterium]
MYSDVNSFSRINPFHPGGHDGGLLFDASTAGGPKVDVVFDAPPVKKFTKAR